jgi:thiol-disulfide isomerase/thioredoxin
MVFPGCRDTHNTMTIQQIENQLETQLSSDAPLTVPELCVLGSRTSHHGDRSFLVADLVLVNPLSVPLTYYGYRMDSWSTRPPAGEISPLYSTQLKDADNSEWQNGFNGWCGTGAATMVVPPKYAGRFDAQIELPVLAARIGVECSWKTSDGQTRQEEVWTREIVTQPSLPSQSVEHSPVPVVQPASTPLVGEIKKASSNGSGVELMIFSAVWCDVCRDIPPVVKQLQQDYPALKITELDLDEGDNLDQMFEYGGDAVPYMFVLVDGEVATKIKGLLPYAKLSERIQKSYERRHD